MKKLIALLFALLLAVSLTACTGSDNMRGGNMTAPPWVPSRNTDTEASSSTQDDDETTWCLILVNKLNPIPDGYEVDLIQLLNERLVDARIYPALQDMMDAARREGVYPVVASGYRTAQEQQSLLDAKIAAFLEEGYSNSEAVAGAEAWVAVPGTSEHQLGIAVDINSDGVHSTDGEVYRWLDQNSHKFGFILRYPANKIEITGVNGEPWHYRYVGVEAATQIHERGICLEEYLGYAG